MVTELVVSTATVADQAEIQSLITEHGENQIVDNPPGITNQLIKRGQMNIGHLYNENDDGELAVAAGWEIRRVPLGRTGRLSTVTLLYTKVIGEGDSALL